MLLSVKTKLVYTSAENGDALLQVEASDDASQTCMATSFSLLRGTHLRDVQGEAAIGLRRWVTFNARLDCIYEAQFEIKRRDVDLAQLGQTPRHEIPAADQQYLLASRYCQSDLFLDFVAIQFPNLTGGALVQSISNWIHANFFYDNGASDSGTTATDSFARMAGVCRDYAHVLIALTRAAGIPARFVSAYAPDVRPQDFHAVAEVFLDGGWHLVDPTGMAQPSDIVRISVGRDAADTSFLTSYGFLTLEEQSVQVTRIAPRTDS